MPVSRAGANARGSVWPRSIGAPKYCDARQQHMILNRQEPDAIRLGGGADPLTADAVPFAADDNTP